MKRIKKKESTSEQVIFATSKDSNPELAFSGVFPDDFSMVLNRGTGVISNLVGKNLMNTPGLSKWFDCLVDADNKLVEISKLEAKSIAELELKLDLHNLVWQ
jgi:hypothetical protein